MALVVQVMPVIGWQTVLDPCHGLAPVPRPHLLDTESQNRALRGCRDHGGEMQRRAPSGTGVVDVDDRHIAQSGLAQPGLAAHAGLIVQPSGRRVADDDEPELVGREAGIRQRLVGGLVRHRLGREIAPAHVGHAGAEDRHVGRCHRAQADVNDVMRRPTQGWGWERARKATRNDLKFRTAPVPATMTMMWRAPAST